MLIEPASGEYKYQNISMNVLRNWKMVLTYHGCDTGNMNSKQGLPIGQLLDMFCFG